MKNIYVSYSIQNIEYKKKFRSSKNCLKFLKKLAHLFELSQDIIPAYNNDKLVVSITYMK